MLQFSPLLPGLALALVCAGQLPAQDRDAIRAEQLIPSSALFVAEMDGPAKFAELLEKTRLGSALSSPKMLELIEPLWENVQEELRPALEAMGVREGRLSSELQQYGGRLTLAFGFAMPEDGRQIDLAFAPPPVWVMGVLSPDGATDLRALAQRARALLLRDQRSEPTRMVVDGHDFEVVELDGETITLPVLLHDHLVMFVGTEMRRLLGESLAARDRVLPAAEGANPAPFAMRIAIPRLIDFVRMGLVDVMSPFDREEQEQLKSQIETAVRRSGLDALGEMRFTMRAANELVEFDVALQLAERDRGIFDALLVEQGRPFVSLPLLPFDKGDCNVMRLDTMKLADTILDVAAVFSDQTGMDRNAMEQAFENYLRVRLREDLLAHLGTELFYFEAPLRPGTPAPEGLPEEFAADPDIQTLLNTCWGMTVRDGDALQKSILTLLRSRALHVTLKSTEYRGARIQTLRPMGFPVHFCVHAPVFLLAFGESGGTVIRDLLDPFLDAAEGQGPVPMPEGVLVRKKLLPESLVTFGTVNTPALIETIFSVLGEDLEITPDEDVRDEMARASRTIRDLLESFELRYMVQGTWEKGGIVHQRMYW